MILVPVKNLANAKQRLAPALEQADRSELAHAMLSDVVDALVESSSDDISLVTTDPFAVELAREHHLAIIPDESNISETDAIEMATRHCKSRRVECTLVVPGDIPLISSAEVRTIYKHAPQAGTVLVPSRDKRGTNAVLRRPCSLFPLRFGNDSFMPHLTAAISTDATCVVLSLPGIALDIDTAEDLHALAQVPGEKQSQILARNFGFGYSDTQNSAVAAKP